jgi:hypothetical protein
LILKTMTISRRMTTKTSSLVPGNLLTFLSSPLLLQA